MRTSLWQKGLSLFAAIVGRLGAAPLGAVGLSNLVFFFCQAFFGFLLIVTTPRVANAIAIGDSAEVNLPAFSLLTTI